MTAKKTDTPPGDSAAIDTTAVASLYDLPPHPACALLPRLSDAEIDELANDIREQGQRDAIVVWIDRDSARWVLDGRHRLEACRRAGVEPRVVEATAEQIVDPTAFVLSKNILRRNLNAAQRAVAVVLLRSDQKWSARKMADGSGVGREYVRQAVAIVEHDRKLAEKVLRNEVPIRQAHMVAAGQVERESTVVDPPAGLAATDTKSTATGRSTKGGRVTNTRNQKNTKPLRRSVPAEERANKSTSAADDQELQTVVAACGMLASVKDPYALVQRHGDPANWRYFTNAKRVLLDLEDAV